MNSPNQYEKITAEFDCPACKRNRRAETSVPVMRIIQKLDKHLKTNDLDAAERHLDYWQNEAVNIGDIRGELSVVNEFLGLTRRMNKREKGLSAVSRALELLSLTGSENSSSGATVLLNAATTCKAFDHPERSVELYERTMEIYKKQRVPENDLRYAALYNNYGTTLVDLKEFEKAEEYYKIALKITSGSALGLLDNAVTEVNMAHLYEAAEGLESEKIAFCLERAEKILSRDDIAHNSHFAFVCEKCAPSFDYFGYFLFADKLRKLSRKIYGRTLELSRKFYEKYGREAIENNLPEAAGRIAVGLAGEGSECFGYDDEISTDHDFEAGFCIWLTDDDYKKFGFRLERIYAKLPREFEGYKRNLVAPVGGSRHGVMKISDFYMKFLGTFTAPVSLEQWLSLPSDSLACAANGEVFDDGLGEFSKIRGIIKKGYPEDVRLKKIAANLIMAEQTGLYNYVRCMRRGEHGAAQLCVFGFVKHVISLIYLLNCEYEPFYKWAYRGMRKLEKLQYLEASLVSLTELGNGETEAKAKAESMEEISRILVSELKSQGLTSVKSNLLEDHAVSLQNKITDSNLRNMHILSGI